MSTQTHTLSSRLVPFLLCVFTAAYSLKGYSNEIAEDNSSAIGYRCTMGNAIRRVEINYPLSPKTLPCEVIYYKDTEQPNNPEVLWRAEQDASYCETQADAMVYNLTTKSDWKCSPK